MDRWRSREGGANRDANVYHRDSLLFVPTPLVRVCVAKDDLPVTSSIPLGVTSIAFPDSAIPSVSLCVFLPPSLFLRLAVVTRGSVGFFSVREADVEGVEARTVVDWAL